MTSLAESLSILIPRWRRQKIKLLPPESPVRIAETLGGLGVKANAEVLTLYAHLGGMEEMDSQYWRLWSVDEIREENKGPSVHGVLFSDYLIDSWRFRLRGMENGESEVLVDLNSDDKPPRTIARSLGEFFAAYVENPQDILCA